MCSIPGLQTPSSFSKQTECRLFALRHPNVASIIRRVRGKHLTYLELSALVDLSKVAIQNERHGIAGLIIEAGCALGGSAIVLASAKSRHRPLHVYDAFDTIPPPSDKDGQDAHNRYNVIASGQSPGIGGHRYYGYERNLYDKVRDTFEEFKLPLGAHNVHLVKGLFQDTLRIEEPVALAHIDCDWYDSVTLCLNRIEPHVVPGGTLIIDDYNAWSGCKRAVDEYFSGRKIRGYEFITRSRLHIVKA